MKKWFAGLLLLWPAFVTAAIEDDPVEVNASRENGRVTVTARFLVPVSRELAWGVLTDYEKMPVFLPNLSESKVVQKTGSVLRIQQKGTVPFVLFSINYVSMRDVELLPDFEIRSNSVDGNTGQIHSVSKLLSVNSQTEYKLSTDWTPTSQIIAVLGTGTLRDLISQQLQAMRREMLRRQLLAK